MNIVYQSPNYDPASITNRYLHVEFWSGRVIVEETVKTKRTNYTYRSYELSESDRARYSSAIADAMKIMHRFPNCIEIKEDAVCTISPSI
jgi:hypothetical protein